MAWYGVGTRYGGFEEQFFFEGDSWKNGYCRFQKENYDELINEIQIGDVLVAKSHGFSSNPFIVEAVGIVIGLSDKSKKHDELKVAWIKKFDEPVRYLEKGFVGGNRVNTIFRIDNPDLIKDISVHMLS